MLCFMTPRQELCVHTETRATRASPLAVRCACVTGRRQARSEEEEAEASDEDDRDEKQDVVHEQQQQNEHEEEISELAV